MAEQSAQWWPAIVSNSSCGGPFGLPCGMSMMGGSGVTEFTMTEFAAAPPIRLTVGFSGGVLGQAVAMILH
ncbi:hypothetical protein [Pseudorhodobacter ferrugineus]|uniref:hypothetical protein n=1 Tax=Pseudorhodobacter ferrugineus TaxID=77008 RepID=UPI0012DBE10F|nr:hypothetical protein [Pseudorhodobacter ferrugineus]